jgi:hypothetical protein
LKDEELQREKEEKDEQLRLKELEINDHKDYRDTKRHLSLRQ